MMANIIFNEKAIHSHSADINRIIEMAWEDRTPFEAIEKLYQLNESQVTRLMRKELNPVSFKVWRQRVTGRKTKHQSLRLSTVSRFRCASQHKQCKQKKR